MTPEPDTVDTDPNQLVLDPFLDESPITCGIENPEACESCQ